MCCFLKKKIAHISPLATHLSYLGPMYIFVHVSLNNIVVKKHLISPLYMLVLDNYLNTEL